MDASQAAENLSGVKKAFDLLSDHIVITDSEGRILFINQAAQKGSGFTASEAIGKKPGELWGGTMPKSFYEKMWQTIKEDKQPFVGEVQNTRKDGTKYWQELHITPILDKLGEVRFFIGLEPDITDRKEQQKFRDEFISIMAHQMKSPLTATKWGLDLLSERGGLDDQHKGILKKIVETNETLIELVTDLVAVARVGSVREHATDLELGQLLDQVVGETRNLHRQVKINFEKDAGEIPLHLNPQVVREVFQNLISNAVLYADDTEPEVLLTLRRDNEYVIVSIQNNGPAIPEDEQVHLFEKFFRGTNALSRKKKGSGLGLFIVKLMCDSLGWEVSFQSPINTNGTGTEFTVRV